MDTGFYITLTLKTQDGENHFGKFCLGNNRERAYEIFSNLRGTSDVNEKNVLYIDFIEKNNGLPLNIKMVTCTLDELGENCKIITKELFKLENLDLEN